MKYKIRNEACIGGPPLYLVYRKYYWVFWAYEGAFNTEKEAAEFIEERIRLEKKYK